MNSVFHVNSDCQIKKSEMLRYVSTQEFCYKESIEDTFDSILQSVNNFNLANVFLSFWIGKPLITS